MEKSLIEISPNGIVWDQETNKILGHYPTHLAVDGALQLLGDLRLKLELIEFVRDKLRSDGNEFLAEKLDTALEPLVAIRDDEEAINERMAA